MKESTFTLLHEPLIYSIVSLATNAIKSKMISTVITLQTSQIFPHLTVIYCIVFWCLMSLQTHGFIAHTSGLYFIVSPIPGPTMWPLIMFSAWGLLKKMLWIINYAENHIYVCYLNCKTDCWHITLCEIRNHQSGMRCEEVDWFLKCIVVSMKIWTHSCHSYCPF